MGKEKKEIWKLIELLNEYDSPNWWKETEEGIDNVWKIYEFHSELQIISKKYWFIKWLVENDKIDIHNIPPISITRGGEETAYNEPVMLDDSLLMILSISNSPIEDLLLYLK